MFSFQQVIQRSIKLQIICGIILILICVVLSLLVLIQQQDGGAICGVLLNVVMVGWGLYILWQGLRQKKDYLRHPIIEMFVQSLSRYGDGLKIFREIEVELGNPILSFVAEGGYIRHELHITRQWILVTNVGQRDSFTEMLAIYFQGAGGGIETIKAVYIPDVVWFYKSSRTTYYGRSTMAQDINLNLCDKYGESVRFAGSDVEVDNAFSAVAPMLSHAVAGYDKAIETAWKTDPASIITEGRNK